MSSSLPERGSAEQLWDKWHLDAKEFNIVGLDGPIKLDISIKEGLVGDKEEQEALLKKTEEQVIFAYEYLAGIFKDEFPISKHMEIELGYREQHAALGALIKLSAKQIKKDIENKDQYYSDVSQSIVVHELLHNLTDDEALPMLAEFIYILEKNGTRRINEVKEFLQEGKLKKQYVVGLNEITTWLGFSTKEELFEKIGSQKIEDIKECLRFKVKDAIQKETIDQK